jgi:glycosyltransferase involved in cell wall biosynthesis
LTLKLLTIGHSYVVASNRRLAHEMAVQGRGRWSVTAAAPKRLNGDLREVVLEPIGHEASRTEPLAVRFGWSPHLRHYEPRVRAVLNRPWSVVHIWEEPYVAAAAQIASAAPPDARVVPATFQNLVKRYPPPFSYFERRVMRRAAGWIAFGETVHAAQSSKSVYAGLPSRVIAPGVDVCRFRPDAQARRATRGRLGWDERIPVVGFLGRFVAEKGLSTLMEALDRAREPWRALFIGGGAMERELATFALAHPERVRILTDIGHDEVPAHLNAMDLLCAPSETTSRWREQFGRMLVEALASGVPIIASRSGEIPHVIGDAGLLVNERDVPRWAEAIDRLLGDSNLRGDLAACGLTRVHERFALPVVARAHLSFFEELL